MAPLHPPTDSLFNEHWSYIQRIAQWRKDTGELASRPCVMPQSWFSLPQAQPVVESHDSEHSSPHWPGTCQFLPTWLSVFKFIFKRGRLESMPWNWVTHSLYHHSYSLGRHGERKSEGWGESRAERSISSGKSSWSLFIDGKGLDEYLSKQLSGMKKRLQEGEEIHVSDW